MWEYYVAALLISLAVGSLLARPPKLENAKPALFGDFNFPRAKHGDPVPIIFGTVRHKAPTVIWSGDYIPVPITQKVKTGLFGSKRHTTGYKNFVGLDMALCLGPDIKFRRIFADNDEIWSGNQGTGTIFINLPELFGGESEGGGLVGTIALYDGNFAQGQDSYLFNKLGFDVPAYTGIARAVFRAFYIGTSTTPKPFSFELSRMTSGLHPTYSIMPNGLDLNPMEVIYDAFTQRWGRFGSSASDLDLTSFTACAQTLYNEGLGMSLIVQSSISGSDLVEEVMKIADGVLYQDPSTGKITAKLIRQDYTAESLLVLDESCVSEVKNFQKTTWESTYNQCRVSFDDRANNYDESAAIAQDFANINYQNRVKSTNITAMGCKTAETASKLAARQLSMMNVPLYKCEITATRKAHALRPGSVFVLNWGPFAISNMVMRVVKIDFGDMTSNSIKISCAQDRFSLSTVTFAPPEATGWTPTVTAPQNVVTRTVFTPPAFLSFAEGSETAATFDSAGRLYCAAVGPSNASISFDCMFSTDNFATSPIVAIDDAPYGGGGLLLNAYSATVAQDTRYDASSAIIVTGIAQAAIDSLVQATTLDQARDGSALFMINNEWFAYVGFVDNGNGQVTFPKVYRGILDTVPANHAANDRVWFISASNGLIPDLLPVGATGYIKLIDNTVSATLPIASATMFSGAVTNRAGLPLPPQYLTLNGSRTPTATTGATSVAVAWKNRSRVDSLLRVYNDAADTREADTQTRIRWRVGAGGYTTVTTTGSNTTLNVTGLTGTLEVIIDSQIISNSKYSTHTDTLTMTLN